MRQVYGQAEGTVPFFVSASPPGNEVCGCGDLHTLPTQDGPQFSVNVPDIPLVVACTMPEPVMVQAKDCGENEPAGKFSSICQPLPDWVAVMVPFCWNSRLSIGLKNAGPVAVVPSCVAVHVTPKQVLTLGVDVNVPAQFPLKSANVAGGPVGATGIDGSPPQLTTLRHSTQTNARVIDLWRPLPK